MSIDHTDEDVLRDLYWKKEFTLEEIANKAGVAESTIHSQLAKNNIETRSRGRNPHPGVHEHLNNYMRIYHQDVDGEQKTMMHHRFIAVAIYGIDAVKNMEVHHKSGHGLDNRHGNLALMKPEEHARHHAEQQSNS